MTENAAAAQALMDKIFKFKIGAIVATVGVSDEQDEGIFHQEKQARFVVNEQILQRCHGGVQMHYQIRAVSSDGHLGGVVQVPEIMLKASMPFEAASVLEERRQAKREAMKKAVTKPEPGPDAS